MLVRLVTFLLVATALALTASPAWAHGGGAGFEQGADAATVRNILLTLSLLTVVLLIRFMPPTDRSARGDDPEAGIELPLFGVGRYLGLAAFVVLLWMAYGGQTADPFALIVLFMTFVSYGLPIVAAVFGNFPTFFAPTLAGTVVAKPDQERPFLAGALLLIALWFWVANADARTPRGIAIALTVYFIVMVAIRVRMGARALVACDPFLVTARSFGAISPLQRIDGRFKVRLPLTGLWRQGSTAGITGLLFASAVLFEALEDDEWWLDWVGTAQGMQLTLHHTAGFLGILVGVTAVVAAAAAIGEYLSRLTWRHLLLVVAPASIPVALAMLVAHDLVVLLTAVQDWLFVVWDPFGKGWRPFGAMTQGVTATLVGPYLATVQTVALVVGPLLGIVTAYGRVQRRVQGSTTTVVFPILIAIVAFGLLAISWMLSA